MVDGVQAKEYMNIKYFFMKDQIDQKKMSVEYTPTDDMQSDYMSKPLVGSKFGKFKAEIMNMPNNFQEDKMNRMVSPKEITMHQVKRVTRQVHFCHAHRVKCIQENMYLPRCAFQDVAIPPPTVTEFTRMFEQYVGEP